MGGKPNPGTTPDRRLKENKDSSKGNKPTPKAVGGLPAGLVKRTKR